MSKNNRIIQSAFLYTILVFYIILSLSIIIFKYVSPLELLNEGRPIFRSINILPFRTIKGYLTGTFYVSRSVVLKNILGNIGLFIPLGIYLQLLKKDKRIFVSIFFVIIISLSVEIIQFVLAIGAADIDDILLNCAGGIIGILFYRLLSILIKNDDKIRTAVTILSSVIGIPLILMTVILLIFQN